VRRAGTPVVLVVAAGACGLAAGYFIAGTAGLVIVATGICVLALVAIRAGMPPAVRPLRRLRRPADPAGIGKFPSYRRLAGAVMWASVSARHFDATTRPVLIRLLASVLADRHGVDLARSPERARVLVGDDLWPLLDPARPKSDDTLAPGVSLADLTAIVDRLEGL
jgi:hypothetical protein